MKDLANRWKLSDLQAQTRITMNTRTENTMRLNEWDSIWVKTATPCIQNVREAFWTYFPAWTFKSQENKSRRTCGYFHWQRSKHPYGTVVPQVYMYIHIHVYRTLSNFSFWFTEFLPKDSFTLQVAAWTTRISSQIRNYPISLFTQEQKYSQILLEGYFHSIVLRHLQMIKVNLTALLN